MAIDQQGTAVRLRLSNRRASARTRDDLRRAARTGDAHLSGQRACCLAQRRRRRLVEKTRARAAKERELFHRAARCDGLRRAVFAGPLLRDDHRTTLDRARRRRAVGVPVRRAPADPLCEGRRRVSTPAARAREGRRSAAGAAVGLHPTFLTIHRLIADFLAPVRLESKARPTVYAQETEPPCAMPAGEANADLLTDAASGQALIA